MAGHKNIHNHKNANTNGFDKNPNNINREGRPVSIRTQVKELMESEGNITMPSSQVVKVNDDGSVVLEVPTQMQIAMKLSNWAMSKKGNDSLKAIQMIMEQIDGKPDQKIEGDFKTEERLDYSKLSTEALEEIARLKSK